MTPATHAHVHFPATVTPPYACLPPYHHACLHCDMPLQYFIVLVLAPVVCLQCASVDYYLALPALFCLCVIPTCPCPHACVLPSWMQTVCTVPHPRQWLWLCLAVPQTLPPPLLPVPFFCAGTTLAPASRFPYLCICAPSSLMPIILPFTISGTTLPAMGLPACHIWTSLPPFCVFVFTLDFGSALPLPHHPPHIAHCLLCRDLAFQFYLPLPTLPLIVPYYPFWGSYASPPDLPGSVPCLTHTLPGTFTQTTCIVLYCACPCPWDLPAVPLVPATHLAAAVLPRLFTTWDPFITTTCL